MATDPNALPSTSAFGRVDTSFASRWANNSNVDKEHSAAAGVADDIITSVDTLVSKRELDSTNALDDAVQSIQALQSYTPTQINFSYGIPKWVKTNLLTLGNLNSNIEETITTIPKKYYSAEKFTPILNYDKPWVITEIEAPVLYDIPQVDPYHVNSIISRLPVEPSIPSIKMPNYNNPNTTYEDINTSISMPSLRGVKSIEEKYVKIPGYDTNIINEVDSLLSKLPAEINNLKDKFKSILDNMPNVTASNTYTASVYGEHEALVLGYEFIGYFTELAIDEALSYKSKNMWSMFDGVGTSYNLKGKLSDIVNAEEKIINKERSTWQAINKREFTEFYINGESDLKYKTLIQDPLARLDAIVTEAYASTFKNTYSAIANLYNAAVSEYKEKVDYYLLDLKNSAAKLLEWKNKAKAKMSIASMAGHTAELYDAKQDIKKVEADVYAAKLSTLKSKLDMYKLDVEKFITTADISRAKISLYEKDGIKYDAAIQEYKAELDRYNGYVKSVDASNRLLTSKTKPELTKIKLHDSKSAETVASMKSKAEPFKTEPIKYVSDIDSTRLNNALSSIRLSADAAVARSKVEKWGSIHSNKSIEYDFYTSDATSASEYYKQASRSAYQASTQALNATTAVAKASNLLQEAASNSSSSLTTGAYSAISISASLSGTGSIAASNNTSTSNCIDFSDTLKYSYTLSNKTKV